MNRRLNHFPHIFALVVLSLILAGCFPVEKITPLQIVTETAEGTLIPGPDTPAETPRPTTLVPTLVPTSVIEVIEDDLQGTSLQFWHPWEQGKERAINKLVTQFNRENTYGIRVTASSLGYDLAHTIRDAAALETLPDVTIGYTSQLLTWVSNTSGLVDVNMFINDPVWGYSQSDIEGFYPQVWQQAAVNGKQLGVPMYASGQVAYYNQTWAKTLGFDSPPTTPDEFAAQSCAAGASRDDGKGGWIVNTGTGSILGWLFAFGSQVESDGDVPYHFNTPETGETLSFIQELADSSCAWQTTTPYPSQEFANRDALFYTGSIAGIPYQQPDFDNLNSPDQWTVIPVPSEAGDPVIITYASSLAIFKSEPTKELAAWIFIRWLLEPEQQAAWVEASNYFPVNNAALDLLGDFTSQHPQWVSAINLLPYTRTEPAQASWETVRWIVSDAVSALLDQQLPHEEIPTLLEDMDATAAEIHSLDQ